METATESRDQSLCMHKTLQVRLGMETHITNGYIVCMHSFGELTKMSWNFQLILVLINDE